MKRLAINANGNTTTSFAGELNPTGVGSMLMCVCMFVCVYLGSISSLTYIRLNITDNVHFLYCGIAREPREPGAKWLSFASTFCDR